MKQPSGAFEWLFPGLKLDGAAGVGNALSKGFS